jgi:hypothetical protein
MITAAVWLALAQDDLRAAELLAQHSISRLSCFHAQQAVEKALRALRLHQVSAGIDRPGPPEADAWLLSPNAPSPADQAPAEAAQTARQLLAQVTERIYGQGE